MSPSSPCSICSEAYRVISTFSFDPNFEPCPQNLHRGEARGPPESILKWLRHLLGGGLRSSRMPHEGYADPTTNDGPRFCSNAPVSELTERITRAIEASDVSLAPLVAETADGVTHKTRPTPTKPNRAQGLRSPDADSGKQPTAQVAGETNMGKHPEWQKHRSLRPQERVPGYLASNRLTSWT